MLDRVEKLNCDKGTKFDKDIFNCAEDALNVDNGTKSANDEFKRDVETPPSDDKLIILQSDE